MPPITVNLSDEARETLYELAGGENRSLESVLERALEVYRRESFLEKANKGYAALREDAASNDEWEKEQKLFENTLMDGLDPEEDWDEEGKLVRPPRSED